MQEEKVTLGSAARSALGSLLEQSAGAILISTIETWYAARGEPVPEGKWKLVIESATLIPVAEAPIASPSEQANSHGYVGTDARS